MAAFEEIVMKILSGSSTPNLTGGSYGHSVDGIPFYNTSEEKLYILGDWPILTGILCKEKRQSMVAC